MALIVLGLVCTLLLVIRQIDCVPYFITEPIGGTYSEGDDVILYCAIGDKVGTVIWYKDSVDISYDNTMNGNSNSRQSVLSPTAGTDYNLHIFDVIVSDSGEYQCVETTGPSFSQTVTITVTALPPQSFRTEPLNTTKVEGHNTTLHCEVDNKDGVVHWVADGVDLSNDDVMLSNADRYTIIGVTINGEYNLHIAPTLPDDTGVYVCTVDAADNSVAILSRESTLSVTPLQRFERQPVNRTVTQHDDVLLECDVVHKNGDVEWFKNNTRISIDYIIDDTTCDVERFSISGSASEEEFNLQINDTQLNDSATYWCEVTASGQIPLIRAENATLTVLDFDECSNGNICGNDYLCINTKGSYHCVCTRPQGCTSGEFYNDCFIDVGLYRCSCHGIANSTYDGTDVIQVSPPTYTDGPYAIRLYDGRSTCTCYRCILDNDVQTGKDLLQCHQLAASLTRMCPATGNQTSWYAKFSEIALIAARPITNDSVLADFNTVFKEAIIKITSPLKQSNSDAQCSTSNCTDIMDVLEVFGMALVQELDSKYDNDKVVTLEFQDEELGLTLQVQRVTNDNTDQVTFPSDDESYLILPKHILTLGTRYIVNARYDKPGRFINNNLKSVHNDMVNSVILSSTVSPSLPGLLPIDSPVRIIFEHLHPVTSFQNMSSSSPYMPTCNFVQTSPDMSDSRVLWNSSGCEVYETNDTYTICHCYHLTSFAVLMRVTEFDMGEVHEKALEIISLVGCSISLLSLTLTLLTFFILRKFTQERVIHINLCFSIGFGQVIFMSGIGATSNQIACMLVAILLHYFFTSVFCWMLVEGIQLYAKLVRVFDSNPTKRMTIYFFIGWGVPMFIVIISVAADHVHYGSSNNCWLAVSSGLIWAFVGPALVIILTNVVFLGMVVRVISRLQNCAEDDKYTKVRASVKAAIVLLPLLGMTWLFGLVSVNRHTIFFEYVFAILNSLQGFFIFVFYCFNSSEVRAQLARKKQTIELTHGLSFSSAPTTSRYYSSNQVRPSTTSEEVTNTNIASRSSIRLSVDNGPLEDVDVDGDNLM
ncbi:adhesion G protein-coupled receptor L4-like [Glandiceps talaboti]